MDDKILFVDDERAILDGYKRILYSEFQIDLADGAAQAFDAIKQNGPYSVVVSDMRMPVMNGAEFLGQVRQNTPDTVRMLLTGYTDLDGAIAAVNQGNIFRFLTKPCEPEVLASAITAGILQYRLITSERELLEKTLLGSIKVLSDVLSAAAPEAFGRSLRMAHYVRHIMKKFTLPAPWCLEAAARLSQLGCITLEGELMRRAYAGGELNKEEQAAFDAHPQAAMELLKDIPRLEPAAWIIGQQLKRELSATEVEFAGFSATDLLLGAQILKLAVAYEQLRTKIPAKNTILTRLRERKKEFESNLIDTLIDLEPDGAPKQLRKVLTSRLRTGMILDQEIKNVKGVVLVAKGQEVTSTLIIRLENHANAGAIDREVMAYVPM